MLHKIKRCRTEFEWAGVRKKSGSSLFSSGLVSESHDYLVRWRRSSRASCLAWPLWSPWSCSAASRPQGAHGGSPGSCRTETNTEGLPSALGAEQRVSNFQGSAGEAAVTAHVMYLNPIAAVGINTPPPLWSLSQIWTNQKWFTHLFCSVWLTSSQAINISVITNRYRPRRLEELPRHTDNFSVLLIHIYSLSQHYYNLCWHSGLTGQTASYSQSGSIRGLKGVYLIVGTAWFLSVLL